MADKKKIVEQEDKVLAAEKHVDELVQKGLLALEEMRKLNQEQVDYIVAKASVAALLMRTGSLLNMQLKKLVAVYLKTRQRKTFLPVSTLSIICAVLKLLVL